MKCEKCGAVMKREPFVLDTWHNSGASPHARFTHEEFERFVPADFLTEGMDQTRGWANTLLLEHVYSRAGLSHLTRPFCFKDLLKMQRAGK